MTNRDFFAMTALLAAATVVYFWWISASTMEMYTDCLRHSSTDTCITQIYR